jgi:uncharacterized repeat protein (TIGR01451 family)
VPSPVADPIGLAAGNLLGTGSNDLVVVNGGEQCSTSVMPGNLGAALLPNNHNGTGTFGSPVPIFQTTADVPAPFLSAVAVADMNLDGTPDVVISANDGIHILLNSKPSPGTFTDQGAIPLYANGDTIVNASQIDVADFNDDGAPDVAAAIGGITYVFSGDGSGGLLGPTQGFASGINSGQVRAIDVDGNLSPDMLVSNSQGFSVVINSGSAQAPPGSPAHLVLVANVTSQEPFTTSSQISAGFILRNQGPGSATHMKVTITLPSGLGFVSGGTSNFPCTSVSTTQAVCSLTAFAFEEESPAIPLVFEATQTGSFTVSLTAASDEAESVPTSDAAATLAFQVGGSQANTSIAVTNSPIVVAVGTPVLYTVTLTNSGPNPATNVVFGHALEPSISLGAYPSYCRVIRIQLSSSLTCSLGTLAANSSASLSFWITPTVATTLTNPFLFTQDQADGGPESTSDDVTVLASLMVPISITENITVTDAPALSDIAVTENLTVTDTPFVVVSPAPLATSAPVAYSSVGSLGFNTTTPGQTATQTFALSNIGGGQLNLTSESISTNSPFSLVSIACTNGAASLPTVLMPSEACFFTVQYVAPATPTNGSITFTDNAPLNNIANGSSTQTIPLSGSQQSDGAAPSAPSATVTIPTITENITVSDTVSPPPSIPFVITIGSKLGSLILDPTAGVEQYIATMSLSNGGNIASGVQVTGATLNGAASTSLPIALSLGPDGTANVTLNFPSSAETSGAHVVLSIQGTYSTVVVGGKTLSGSWTGNFRVTLPASSN